MDAEPGTSTEKVCRYRGLSSTERSRKRRQLLREKEEMERSNLMVEPREDTGEPVNGRSRSEEQRERRDTARKHSAEEWTLNHFDKHLLSVDLNSICDVCDRFWWTNDTLKARTSDVKQLLMREGFLEKEEYNICKSCYRSLKRGKIPALSTTNGFVYPPVPADLPELDMITERLVSPRLPFLQIRELRWFPGAKKMKGRIINVPVDVNEMLKMLPRELSDDKAINVNISKHISHNSSVYKGFVRKHVVKRWLAYLVETPLYRMYNIKVDENLLAEVTDDSDLYDENELMGTSEYVRVVKPEDERKFNSAEALAHQQQTLVWDDGYALKMAPGQGNFPSPVTFDEHAEELSFPSIYYGHPRVFKIKVTHFQMVTSELRRSDRRGVVPEKILYAACKQLRKRVIDSFRQMFRSGVEGLGRVTKENMFDAEFVRESLDRNLSFFRSVPNSMQYWSNRKKDLFAMMRQLDKPTFFLTLSASEMFWPKLLRILLRFQDAERADRMTDQELIDMLPFWKAKMINEDPVVCDLYFTRLVETFVSVLSNLKGPLGRYHMVDFFKRIEFQHRGSAHVHMLIWLANAPTEPLSEDMPETVKMIDSLVTCDSGLLEPETHREFQTHKHTFTCYKKTDKKVCRFGAPFWPMRSTMILLAVAEKEQNQIRRFHTIHYNMEYESYDSIEDFFQKNMIESEEEYFEILRHGISRPTVFLRRDVTDLWTNPFNPLISKILQSNMDLQYILDAHSCATYVADYINKSERGFSGLHRELVAMQDKFPEHSYDDLMKEISKNALNNVEMSTQEAAWFLLRQKMSECSRVVRYIPTQHPSERFASVKSKSQLALLPAGSTDVWQKNIIQHYECRPVELEAVCLAEFVSDHTYGWQEDRTSNSQDDEEAEEESENENNETLDKRVYSVRRRRTRCIIRYRNYNRTDLLNYKRECVLLFHPFRSEELDLLDGDKYIQIFDECQAELFAKRKEYDSGLDLDQITEYIRERKTEFDEKQNTEEVDQLGSEEGLAEIFKSQSEAVDRDISTIVSGSKVRKIQHAMSSAEYCNMMRGLNTEQRDFVLHIINHTCYRTPETPPLQVFFTGPAGSGKSYVLRAAMESINRFALRHDTTKNAFIACATTGKAAVNIDGTTIHSALNLPINANKHGLSCERAQTMRCDFKDIAYILIDEVSMLSSKALKQTDENLRIVRNPYMSLGGFDTILCGDLRQLAPVRAKPPYERPANLLERDMVWHNLSYYPLQHVVRQSDAVFSGLLTKIGDGQELSSREKELIESRFVSEEESELLAPDAIRIFWSNKKVDDYNYKLLDVPGAVTHTSEDTITGHSSPVEHSAALDSIKRLSLSDTGNMAKRLVLVLDRPYMLTHNLDKEDRLVNGIIGHLRHIENVLDKDGLPTSAVERIWLEFSDAKTGMVRKKKCAAYAKAWDLSDNWVPFSKVEMPITLANCIKKKQIRLKARRKQFPVIAANAITIHKSQGASYDKVIYYYNPSHISQLVYVAMSRARTIEGLFLVSETGKHEFTHSKQRDMKVLKTELQRLERRRLETINDRARKFISASDLLCTLYLNVQSLQAHVEDLSADTIVSSVHLLSMTETWMEDERPVPIEGFKLVTSYKRAGIRAGGVAIYESLALMLDACEPVNYDEFHSKSGDVCCALISHRGRRLALITVYASCGINALDMAELLDAALWRFADSNANMAASIKYGGLNKWPVLLLGDLNYDFRKPSGEKILTYVGTTYGLELKATEVTTRQGSCIDYVLARGIDSDDTVLKTFKHINYFGEHRQELVGLSSISTSVLELGTGAREENRGSSASKQ